VQVKPSLAAAMLEAGLEKIDGDVDHRAAAAESRRLKCQYDLAWWRT